MYDFRSFDQVFDFDPGFAYERALVNNITAGRKEMKELFIDKVLKLVDIKRPAKHYPPSTNADLRSLHQLVVDSAAADHAKLSVLYYVLLDYDDGNHEGFEATKFAERSCLPEKHQMFMKGLWHLDKGENDVALQYLTHPSLIPTFQEEILEALVRAASSANYSIPLAYYYTVQPTITSARTLDSLLMIIAETSVSEAFFFARSQAETTHQIMFESLISHVLSHSSNEHSAQRAVELLNLPFSQTEEAWFEDYLTTGGGRQYKKAKDTIMIRRIATGRYSEAHALGGMDGKSVNGLNWEKLRVGLRNGMGPRLP